MINIHWEYVTPHIICVRGKLNENLISLLSIYGRSVDSCNLVGVWMVHRFHSQSGD